MNADGSIERFKARLVAKGFTQVHMRYYSEWYAPVSKQGNCWLLLPWNNYILCNLMYGMPSSMEEWMQQSSWNNPKGLIMVLSEHANSLSPSMDSNIHHACGTNVYRKLSLELDFANPSMTMHSSWWQTTTMSAPHCVSSMWMISSWPPPWKKISTSAPPNSKRSSLSR